MKWKKITTLQGSPDTGEQIVAKINDLDIDDEDLLIDAIHIKNFPKFVQKEVGGVVARNIYQMGDVVLSSLANGEVLKWNSTTNRWENGTGGGGGVTSVNSATGDVALTVTNSGTSGSLQWDGTELQIPTADNNTTGLLSDTDWGFFTNTASTGILSLGACSINVDPTKINVGAIKAWFVDNTTDPVNPTKIYLDIAAQTGVDVTYRTTNAFSYIGVDSTGTLIQQTTQFTPTQTRTIIPLLGVGHPTNTNILSINVQPIIAYNTGLNYADLCAGLGLFNVTGNIFSANGANLNLNKTAGSIFNIGDNYETNTSSPNINDIGAFTAGTFAYRNSTLTYVGANTTTIDPDTWESPLGTNTTVSNNKFTIQKIWLAPRTPTVVRIQYGQTQYNSMSEAIQGLNDSFTNNSLIEALFVPRAFLIIKKGTTDLTDTTKVKFIEAPKFPGGSTVAGAGTTNLQQAYNNSTIPQILTDATLGAVTLKRGSAADTDKVLDIFNGAGASTAEVRGDGTGVFMGIRIHGTGTSNTFTGADAGNYTLSGSRLSVFGNEAGLSLTSGSDNSLFGYQAGNLIDTATGNSAFGSQAGSNLTTGSYGTYIGYQAGKNQMTADYNIGIGYLAMRGSLVPGDNTGSSNIAIGYSALQSNSSAESNIAIGLQAMQSNTTGGNNTAIGQNALQNNTSGTLNIAIGVFALNANTTASQNIAVGVDSLRNSTTGTRNAAIGYNTGNAVTSGSDNIFFGDISGQLVTTGNQNTFIGSSTGSAATTASDNILVGFSAGVAVTTALQNTVIGSNSGLLLTTGANNTIIGYRAGSNVATTNTSTLIGAFSGRYQTTATNTAVGYQSLQGNSTPANNTGSGNTAFGYQALLANSSGNNNVAVGLSAGSAVTSGGNNTFVGTSAGLATVSASSNTGIGYRALYQATAGNNIGIGDTAGGRVITGSDNIYIGVAGAGDVAATSLSQNIGIGSSTLIHVQGGSNVAIGYGAAMSVGAYNTSIGYQSMFNCSSTPVGNICLGLQSGYQITGDYNIFLGYGAGANATTSSSIAIGYNANVTADYQMVIGAAVAASATGNIANVYFNGVTHTAPAPIVLNAAGGSGTNIAGASLTIAGGKGTGNGTPGVINFQTSTAGGSGSTLQTLTTVGSFNGLGIFNVASAASTISTNGININNVPVLRNYAGGLSVGQAAFTGAGIANTSVGFGAYGNFTGSYNVTVGFDAGLDGGSGSSNTIIGRRAGRGAINGSNNIIIGSVAGGTSGFQPSNVLIIGSENNAQNNNDLVANDASIGMAGTSGGYQQFYFGQGKTKASPNDITFNVTGGSGTDNTGSNFILAAGKGTGTGTGGDLVKQTAVPTSTGTTLQTLGDRQRILAKYTTLTESTDTAFASITVATSGTVTGGYIIYTVEANDATDFQALTGSAPFSIVNKAGTLTLVLGTDTQSSATSSGTLTGTLTLVASGTTAQFKMNAVSSLTQTTLRINCQIIKNFGIGVIAAI